MHSIELTAAIIYPGLCQVEPTISAIQVNSVFSIDRKKNISIQLLQ